MREVRPMLLLRPRMHLFLWGSVIVSVGAWLRFAGLGRYSLWRDEAWVALTVHAPTIHAMLFPTWYAQSTPPLFLIFIRWITAAFGSSEAVFRLLPALTGSLSVLLIGCLTFQWSRSRIAALIAALLWAFHPLALLYAHELKQYTTDVFVLLALLCLMEWYVRRERRWRSFLFLLLIAWVSMSLSHPAVFVLPAVAMRLAMQRTAVSRKRTYTEAALFVPGTGIFFTLQYIFIILPEKTSWLVAYWDQNNQFLPAPLTPNAWFILLRQLWTFASYGVGQTIALDGVQSSVAAIGVVLASTGWISLLRRHGAAAMVVAILLLAVLSASMLRLYPFGGIRLSLFLVPPALILASIGLVRIAGSLGRSGPPMVFAFLLLIIPSFNAQTADEKLPWMIAEMRPLLSRLDQERQMTDAILVHPTAMFSYRFYAGDARQAALSIGHWDDVKPIAHFGNLRRDMVRFCAEHPPGTRGWLLIAGRATGHLIALKQALQPDIGMVRVLEEEGAMAVLVQCGY